MAVVENLTIDRPLLDRLNASILAAGIKLPAGDASLTKELIGAINGAARGRKVSSPEKKALAKESGVVIRQVQRWFTAGKEGRPLVPRTAEGKLLSELSPETAARVRFGFRLIGGIPPAPPLPESVIGSKVDDLSERLLRRATLGLGLLGLVRQTPTRYHGGHWATTTETRFDLVAATLRLMALRAGIIKDGYLRNFWRRAWLSKEGESWSVSIEYRTKTVSPEVMRATEIPDEEEGFDGNE